MLSLSLRVVEQFPLLVTIMARVHDFSDNCNYAHIIERFVTYVDWNQRVRNEHSLKLINVFTGRRAREFFQ